MNSRSFRSAFTVGTAVLALLSSTPLCAAPDDLARCVSPHSVTTEQRIAACTAVIQFENETSGNRALGFGYRGIAMQNQGYIALALLDYEQALALDKTSPASHRVLGNVNMLKGEPAAAFAEFNTAVSLEPKVAENFNGRGNVYAAQGFFDLAIADYTEAIQLDPAYATPLANRASSYFRKKDKDIDRALAEVDKAIAIDPLADNARKSKIAILLGMQKFDDAIAEAGDLIKLNPNLASALTGRGDIYHQRHNFEINRAGPKATQYNELALADFNAAIRLDAKAAPAFIGRGTVLWSMDKYEEAAADLDEAIRLDEFQARAFFARCAVRIAIGRQLDDAIVDCNRAAAQQRNPLFTALHRGFAYLKRGDFSRAISEFDEILSRTPRAPEALYGRGLAKQKNGDVSGGNTDLTFAKRTRPNIADMIGHVYRVN